ncbi:hypothetical protein Mmc1_2813 [Magnetococcus marinus MC-1]|uniref:Phage protein n=1 Tax=Magnetococcus marinus (strain ATCC BAA-1437 / JCM 17883 / MC-1) TaxID=156889 RepID=A0LBG3_MAGMM|nr:hypothetical protein [Magnetococcus marinus]ABK45306.1 hypothetical protein Mmc1_2813 [Magnetococcus marinus MC-1]
MAIWDDGLNDLNAACIEVFGQAIIHTPAGGEPSELSAIFDSSREITTIDAVGVPVQSYRPVIEGREADFLSRPAVGDGVAVGGINYRVMDVQPRGDGWLALILRR